MTLAPVFRSGKLFEVLEREGIVDRFEDSIDRMYQGVRRVHGDLHNVLAEEFLVNEELPAELAEDPLMAVEFLRTYFFLILFSAVFSHVGIGERKLDFYAELSYQIMGTIAAADNLFDSEAKEFLPLAHISGPVFGSILQLMCFERLIMRSASRAVEDGALDPARWTEAHKALLSTMATIGKLEGSEESGYDTILAPAEMVEKVHKVRGGMLFSLVTVAPRILEDEGTAAKLAQVEDALIKLGTAFQLVDDLTDFEFDLTRRSHNILVAEIHHGGSAAEKAKLAELLDEAEASAPVVEEYFTASARRVVEVASKLATESLAKLEEMGFWFPSRLADVVVQGIVAGQGAERMERITEG